ncbi:MAG TPA: amidohydrolase family protein [Burkholderiales bacterium]|nr:amidohydrolase family protein [Burkholderiales bacterium]
MRKGAVAGLLLFGLGAVARADEPCAPPAAVARYAGPLFDAMAQIESGMSSTVEGAMARAGVERMALFARQHHKRNGEGSVLALKSRFPQRIYMGTPKPFSERGDLSDGFLDQTNTYLRDQRYQFIGELLFAHADKAHGEQTLEGERYVAPGGKNVQRLISAVEQRHVPVMLHWEVYDWDRDWPAFHALYARFPAVIFIWPHAGRASHEQVATVVSSHANVMVTLSKKEHRARSLSSEEKAEMLGEGVIDDCGVLRREWRDLFVRYPERFMFATDAHKSFRWAKYEAIVERWRLILGQLPEPLAQSLAWRNAERVYGMAR